MRKDAGDIPKKKLCQLVKASVRLTEDEQELLVSIVHVQMELDQARQRFDLETDETLIDSYIYEIIALTKKYEYFLKKAKSLGVCTHEFRKIG